MTASAAMQNECDPLKPLNLGSEVDVALWTITYSSPVNAHAYIGLDVFTTTSISWWVFLLVQPFRQTRFLAAIQGI